MMLTIVFILFFVVGGHAQSDSSTSSTSTTSPSSTYSPPSSTLSSTGTGYAPSIGANFTETNFSTTATLSGDSISMSEGGGPTSIIDSGLIPTPTNNDFPMNTAPGNAGTTHRSSLIGPIVGGIVGAIAFVVILFLFLRCRRQKIRRRRSDVDLLTDESVMGSTTSLSAVPTPFVLTGTSQSEAGTPQKSPIAGSKSQMWTFGDVLRSVMPSRRRDGHAISIESGTSGRESVHSQESLGEIVRPMRQVSSLPLPRASALFLSTDGSPVESKSSASPSGMNVDASHLVIPRAEMERIMRRLGELEAQAEHPPAYR